MDDAQKNQITDRHKVFSALLEDLRQGPVEIGDLLMALRQVHADRGYLLEQVAALQKSNTVLREEWAEAELAQLRARVAELEEGANLVRAHGQRDTLERVAGWLECEPTMAAIEAQIKASAEDLSVAVLAAEQLRQRVAPPMPLDRAKQIGSDLVRVYAASMGVPGSPVNVERLRSCTLAEMLEAMRVLAETEKREEAEAKAAAQGGRYGHTIYMKVADRGIAAIYALLHHDASDPRAVEPILWIDGAALAAIVMPQQQDDGDEGEEEDAHG